MNVNKHALRKVLLFLFSTTLALVMGEVILQLVLRSIHNRGYFFWPPGINVVFKPSSDIMPGISGDAAFKTNSNGIRGDELGQQHAYRIMTIGASTTLGFYLDQSETWPQLLQENLNRNTRNQQVWVGNCGVSGLNTNHHVVAMQHFPFKEQKIDTVIFLTG